MNVNEVKFVDVFVDLIENGKVASNSNNIEERYEKLDSKLLDDAMPSFEDYLFDKMDEMSEEEYDEWLERLNFEDIEEKDLIKYHLPEEKIKIEIVPGTNFAKNVLETIQSTYNDALSIYKSYISQGNGHGIAFGYSCSHSPKSIFYTVAVFNGCDRNLANKVKKLFKECETKLQTMVKDFNSAQSIFSISINMETSAKSTYIDKEKMDDIEIEDRKQTKERYEQLSLDTYKEISFTIDDVKYKKENAKHAETLENLIERVFKGIDSEIEERNTHDFDDKLDELGLI